MVGEYYAGQQAVSAVQWQHKQIEEQKARTAQLEARMHQAEERIRQLEQHIHYPNQVITDKMTAIKESAARVDTAPMRSDVETIMKLRDFVKRFASDGDLRYKVPYDVNIMADEALGRNTK